MKKNRIFLLNLFILVCFVFDSNSSKLIFSDLSSINFDNGSHTKNLNDYSIISQENIYNPSMRSINQLNIDQEDQLDFLPDINWERSQNQFIITFKSKEDIDRGSLEKITPNIKYLEKLNMAIVYGSNSLINQIINVPGIKDVYTDYLGNFEIANCYTQDLSNEVYTNLDYQSYSPLEYTGVNKLHDMGITGTGIKIAILDSGLDANHTELEDYDNNEATYDPKIIAQKSFLDYDGDGYSEPYQTYSGFHGTSCAGLIVGDRFGVAPDASLISGQVFDFPNGITQVSWIIEGINWAVGEDADIISMSFGQFGYLPGNIQLLMNAAVDTAWEQGVITVVAAGNFGRNTGTICDPGKASRALTVGASNHYNMTTSFSSKGPSINGLIDPDICAPGDNILSALIRNEYSVHSGTSLSTPYVAGIAALLKSAYPSKNNDQIRTALLNTAIDMREHVFNQGAGLVNAKGAYDYLASPLDIQSFPFFSESSPLSLSPGEKFTYQFDIFLESNVNSLIIESSTNLIPYVSIQLIDSNTIGWVRAMINITMPSNDINGTIIIKDGSIEIYETELFLQVENIQNDAGTGTDAGETLYGALNLSVDSSNIGNITYDDQDIYSFSVMQNYAYSVDLSPLTGNLDIYLMDQYGQAQSSSVTDGIEKIEFIAQESATYYVRVLISGTLWSTDSIYSEYLLNISQISNDGLTGFKPLIFTGINGSEAIDTDSDGLFNELRFYFEVNVSRAGNYGFSCSISQLRNEYHTNDYNFYREGMGEYYNVGLHNITFSLDGGILESSGYDGKYIVEFVRSELDDTYLMFFTVLDIFTNVTITQFYNHNEFDPLINNLLSYQINEIDIDNNSISELIQLECEFNFTNTGNYDITVYFEGVESWFQKLPSYSLNVDISTPGIFNITIDMPAQELQFLPEIIIKGIEVSWKDNFIIPFFHKIGDYGLAEFEPLIDTSITDQIIDTNGDSKTDTLQIIFTINSKQDLSIIISTGLPYIMSAGVSIPFYLEKEFDIKEGINNYILNFDIRILAARSFIGSYFFPNMKIEISNYTSTIYFPHLTNSYDISNFEHPQAYFAGINNIDVIKTESRKGLEIKMNIIGINRSDVLINISLKNDIETPQLLDFYFSQLEILTVIEEGTNLISFFIDANDLYIYEYLGFLEIFSIEIYKMDTIRNLSLIDESYHIGCIKDIDYRIFELIYQPFSNIYINGNEDFHSQAGISNWDLGGTRNGNRSHPYIIQNYYFNSDLSNIIYILNTNVYFYLVNCLIIGDNANNGIFLYFTHNSQFINNSIGNTDTAFDSFCSDNISIINNKISKNYNAIDSIGGKDIRISDNIIVNSEGRGILLSYSNNSIIENNAISNNEANGIKLIECLDVNITSNTISYNKWSGLYLTTTKDVIVDWNTLNFNYDAGILVGAPTWDTIIRNNNISYNWGRGIFIFLSDNNTINNNEIIFCTSYAIEIYRSNNTKIKYNDFIRNNVIGDCQAKDDLSTNTFLYNFWDEWTTPDLDPIDGFVDNPYIINDSLGVQDLFPRTEPYRESIHCFLSGPTLLYPNGGELINGTITIQWDAADDIIRGHTITYTLYYSNNSGVDWYPIFETPIMELFYQWNTIELLNGTHYRVRIVALCNDGLYIEDISDDDFSINNHEEGNGKPPNTIFPLIIGIILIMVSCICLSFLLKKKLMKTNKL